MKKSIKIGAACCAFAVAAGLGVLAYGLNKDDNKVSTVSEVLATTQPTTDPNAGKISMPAGWTDKIPYAPSNTGIKERAKSLLKINPDIIGWISIDDTDVDYPVVLDPGEIQENTPFYGPEYYIPDSYYLDHDLDGSSLRCGSLFMDYRDVFGENEDEHSENIVIYGHNMANNTMFGSLRRYRQDYSFYDQSPFIRLSSNYKDYDYVIFAFLITSGSYASTDFVYWEMEELDTKEDYDAYVARCKRDAMVDTGVDVQYGDQLVTLSTCYANEDNSRFLVVARKLRDGEKVGDMSTITRTEEWKKAHEPQPETTSAETITTAAATAAE
ncbi:MAG: class B sortase [Ruminococcus sp.]|nr:class B sortase [Ruminococcus sp.]